VAMRRIFVVATSSVNLVGANSSQAATTSSAAIVRIITLSGAASLQSNTSSTSAVTRVIPISGSASSQGNNASTGAIPAAGTVTLIGAASSQAGSASTSSVSVVLALAGSVAAQSSVSGTGVVAPLGSLIGAVSLQLNTASTAPITIPGGGVVNLVGTTSLQTALSLSSAVSAGTVSSPQAIADYATWLASDAAFRNILIEVNVQSSGVETTRYISSRGWVSLPTDTPANRFYEPLISGGVQFTESIALDGSVSMSYGDIELFNIEGNLDSWLLDVWNNRTIKVFIGDMRWTYSQYKLVFNGVVFGVDSAARDKINIKLSDKLQRLNTPLSEIKMRDAYPATLATNPNIDRMIPLCFGECFNTSPLLVDPVNLVYQVHNGPIESIIEVRDNGLPVVYVADLANGKFTLSHPPIGTITASVQGDKFGGTYINKIADIVQRIVTGYGSAAMRFSSVDLDLAKLAAFNTAFPAPAGIFIADRANVLDVCNQLATSLGARLIVSRAGLLSIVQVSVPRIDSGTAVGRSNMMERSLSVTSLPPVVAGVTLGYDRNYTVQPNLQTGLPAAHIALFAQEWLTVTVSDAPTVAKYNLFTAPVQQDTCLVRNSDVVTEANRRLALYSTQRRIIQYGGTSSLLLEELGNTQTITHPRFGLSGGVSGQIISLATDWLNPKVTIGVLI
jgi:hypothetical protein